MNNEQANNIVLSAKLGDNSEIVKIIAQVWCRCPFEWGVEDYITVQSSQGQLALCALGEVVTGPDRGARRYMPLTKTELHEIK